jgi:hypothetical protein
VTVPGQRFPFSVRSTNLGVPFTAPVIPIQLSLAKATTVSGLLDTGATVNVLPHSVGLSLGADWNAQKVPIQLAGNLASIQAKALLVTATVATFPSVKLAFAWANSDAVPLLLGQINFFAEFDVCFYRHRGEFEVRPKS